MKPLLTKDQIRELDRRAMTDYGIPGILLMENAGLGVVRRIESLFTPDSAEKILILCGKGNNGGDGFVVARHLLNHGYDVVIRIFGDPGALKGETHSNYQMLCQMEADVQRLDNASDLQDSMDAGLIVDALLGTGVTGEIHEPLSALIDWINRQDCPVVSIDLPSGLQADSGQFEGACVRADYTLTMAELKLGLMLYPGRDLAGEVEVVDIASPPAVTESLNIKTFRLEAADITRVLPQRPSDGHKGTFGKVFVLAGSRGMTGAAALCANATLRVGAGLTILGCPAGCNDILEVKCTEVLTQPLPETSTGTLALAARSGIDKRIEWADILVAGPGLSDHDETVQLVRSLIEEDQRPLLLDADGLLALTDCQSVCLSRKHPLIITPHPGELARLRKCSVNQVVNNRVDEAGSAASDFNCVCVLKGAPTVIAEPSGTVWLNPTGNSGMGTGGTGDVLTGMIGGFLAQGLNAAEAAKAGVYLHGLAGDLYAEQQDHRTLIAGDLLEYISSSIQGVEAQTW